MGVWIEWGKECALLFKTHTFRSCCLLPAQVDCFSEQGTPLAAAASAGGSDCVAALLGARADVNLSNGAGWMPLHWAVSRGHFDCARLLVEARSAVDRKTKGQQTPLYWAWKGTQLKCAEMLVDAGAKVSNVKRDMIIPEWAHALVAKRERCIASALALYGVLRKRWSVLGQRVPRDIINILTRLVWESRLDHNWDS